MSYNTELNRIVKRLDASAGRRVARRNAHRDLDTLLRKIRRELREKYPSIAKDGKEIVPVVLNRGERKCPTDGAYVKTPRAFAKHVVAKHGGKCWCGFVPSWKEKMRVYDPATARTVEKVVRTNYDLSRHGTISPMAQRASNYLCGHFRRVKDNLTSHLVYGSIQQLSADTK